MIKKVYIDTSVFGGYFDSEFSEETIPFFKKIMNNNVEILISDILELEIYRAPDFIIDFYESMTNVRKVDITDESESWLIDILMKR